MRGTNARSVDGLMNGTKSSLTLLQGANKMLMMSALLKFISGHRLAIALTIVGMLYVGISAFYAAMFSACPSSLSDVPVYPGAQNVHKSYPYGEFEKDEASSVEITFTTADRPLKVEVWYLGAMKRDGWSHDECGLFQKRGCGWYGPSYYGTLSFARTDTGQTRVTVRVVAGGSVAIGDSNSEM